jgi:N-acetylglucosamine-6-phosphate deacetylase
VRLGVKAALAGGELITGDVDIEDGVIARVGMSPAGSDGIAVPGLVDLHINGIAGIDFLAADPEAHRRAGEALARTGVVAYQATFVSSDESAYEEPLRAADAASTEGAAGGLPFVLGVHLEGPFLSPEWPGAHRLEHLRLPDLALAERLLGAGRVTTMTLAPELPGALELIDWLVARDVLVSCGHSDANAVQAHAAFDRGARAITHVHNAHRRWRPRDPGLGGVALVRPEVTVQAIVDGVHLAPESAFGAFIAARERFCLVTDAIEAAMLDPGDYELGGRPVRLRDGAVRLSDGTLAGSVLTMDQAIRNLVASGADWTCAVHAASTAPARLLGRDDLGRLEPGMPAHITVLDDALRVRRTLVSGREALSASA